MSNNIKHQICQVVRHWFNGFAEYCYKLDNGTTIYISYNNKTIRIETEEQ